MQQEAELLSGLVTASYCFLCDKILQGLNQAISHNASRLHKDNLAWMKTNVFDYFNFTKEPRSELEFCFVCRRYFTSKELLLNHVAAFPHNVLAKAKANLIKDDIREEFALSAEMGGYIVCVICNVDLCNQNNAVQHLNSSAHKMSLSLWKKHLPKHDRIPLFESRWFFCKICGEHLDGTTEALKHYRQHKRSPYPWESGGSVGTQLVDFNNVPKVSVQQTATKISALPAAPSQTNNSTNSKVKDNISETKNLLPKNSKDNNADSKLKESVYEQLDKLIQTLYYSKKVPYEVSLQYLKKVNQQVEVIVKEHKSKNDNCQRNVLSQSQGAVDKPPPPKLSSETSQTGSNNAQLKVIDSLPVQKNTTSMKSVPSIVTKNNLPVEKSISNLLAEVVKRKLEVKQQNKDVMEIQVLDEMEILLTEVYKEEAPLPEILKCLEMFNKELDEQLIGAVQVDTGGDVVSDQTPMKEELTNSTNKTEPPTLDCKEDTPTSSDLPVKGVINSTISFNTELVSSEELTPNFTYTKTELMNLRPGAEHINPEVKSLTVKQDLCCVFNQFMCQKDSLMFQTNLSLPATTKNQLTATMEKPVLGVNNFGCEFSFNSFYDYYSGSDFEAFMDFKSQYLYRSIEDSLNLPNEESEVPEEPDVQCCCCNSF